MSLAGEIEAKLNEVLDKIAAGVEPAPGPERGLGWGQDGQGRIVIPIDVVAKIAASVVQQHTKDEWLHGFATGLNTDGPRTD